MISGIHCLLESFNCKGERQDESFICCRCFEWIFSGIIRCFWCSRIRRQDFGKVDRYLGKAVLYQMFHTGSILAVGLTLMKVQSVSLVWAGWAFFIGIILFSGSLYLYSTTGTKTLAMITPFGGVVFLIGWVLFGYALIKVL